MKLFIPLILLLLSFQQSAIADVNVFACEPEWGSLMSELGGEHVNITTALTSAQDPHYLQAKPSLIASIRRADLLVCSGAQLEVGWLPLLLRRSGNSAIQPGQTGHVMTALLVKRLEIPVKVDRAQGDIHPEGNPHVHLNPRNIKRIATEITKRLSLIDADNAAFYQARGADFQDRWQVASSRWKSEIAPLKGMRVIVHHTSFTYLANWLGLVKVADLEPKPGLPSSGGHLASLLSQFSNNPPRVIIRTPYSNTRPSEWLSERLSVPALELPYTVGGKDTKDLFEVYDETIASLLKANR